MPTNTPTPSPTPTPTAEERAASHLSEIIPWFKNPPDNSSSEAAQIITDIWLQDADLGETVAKLPWLAGGVSSHNQSTIWLLRAIALLDLELARAVVSHPWPIDSSSSHYEQILAIVIETGEMDLELAKQMVEYPWLIDGVSEDELQTLYSLYFITLADIDLARMIANYHWLDDNLTDAERRTLVVLDELARANLELAQSKATFSWISDGVTDDEFARFALDLPNTTSDLTANLTGDLRDYFLDSLAELVQGTNGDLHALSTQPWLTDGLDSEEAAFVIATSQVPYADPMLYQQLLNRDTYFTKNNTISLPLAGDVNIWVFSNTPFSARDTSDALIEKTARISEAFLRTPFPTTDIILSLLYHPRVFVGSFFTGTHMQFDGTADYSTANSAVIAHETAHYYFHGGKNARWFEEGGATFISDIFSHRTGVEELSQTRASAAQSVRNYCMGPNGFENILHLKFVNESPWEWDIGPPSYCFYAMGANFLHSVLETIGEEAMSSAFQELRLPSLLREEQDWEGAIYRAFLRRTPADRKNEFRDLYQTLHGGSFAYPDIDTLDDHGDAAEDATAVVVGRDIQGTLDYMFDFDYFRFQTKEGQKYRINVAHETLRASSVGLYAPDGVFGENQRWESRQLVQAGPEIVWTAPSSDEYYFAVQNFGGETGTYTLTITPVDD